MVSNLTLAPILQGSRPLRARPFGSTTSMPMHGSKTVPLFSVIIAALHRPSRFVWELSVAPAHHLTLEIDARAPSAKRPQFPPRYGCARPVPPLGGRTAKMLFDLARMPRSPDGKAFSRRFRGSVGTRSAAHCLV